MINISSNLTQLQKHGDARGSLVAIEDMKNVPFAIKRVYYMFNCEANVPRGFHAHKDLRQLIIPVAGSCDFILDNGRERLTVHLNDPSKGILVEPMVWHEMEKFSANCILLALASAHYDESDYIRNYDKFLDSVHYEHM